MVVERLCDHKRLGLISVVPHTDEGTVSALKELRLSADDFEVKSIIGRGHFGEVSRVTD